MKTIEELLAPDDRIGKLPKWAQEYIGDLRSEVRHSRGIEKENARLREVQEGKLAAVEGGTAFVDDVSDQVVPIGMSPMVIFGEDLSVTWLPDSGRVEVETASGSLVIYPGEHAGIACIGWEK